VQGCSRAVHVEQVHGFGKAPNLPKGPRRRAGFNIHNVEGGPGSLEVPCAHVSAIVRHRDLDGESGSIQP
jgi:hypothetical protein